MRHRHTSEQGSPGLQARSEETGFGARVAERDGEVVVEVRGEIDLATGEALWRAIEVASSRSRRLVIDLTETTFIDSSGLAILIRAHRLLGQIPGAIVLRGPNPTARKLLDISGLDRLVTVEAQGRKATAKKS